MSERPLPIPGWVYPFYGLCGAVVILGLATLCGAAALGLHIIYAHACR